MKKLCLVLAAALVMGLALSACQQRSGDADTQKAFRRAAERESQDVSENAQRAAATATATTNAPAPSTNGDH